MTYCFTILDLKFPSCVWTSTEYVPDGHFHEIPVFTWSMGCLYSNAPFASYMLITTLPCKVPGRVTNTTLLTGLGYMLIPPREITFPIPTYTKGCDVDEHPSIVTVTVYEPEPVVDMSCVVPVAPGMGFPSRYHWLPAGAEEVRMVPFCDSVGTGGGVLT